MAVHDPSEDELQRAIAEAIDLAKPDARGGLEPRSPNAMPDGLTVAWDQYEEAFNLELEKIESEN